MVEYVKFYCCQDVRILKQGFQKFRKMCWESLNIDVNKTVPCPPTPQINISLFIPKPPFPLLYADSTHGTNLCTEITSGTEISIHHYFSVLHNNGRASDFPDALFALNAFF